MNLTTDRSTHRPRPLAILVALLALAIVAGCSAGGSPGAQTSAADSVAPTVAASPAATASPVARATPVPTSSPVPTPSASVGLPLPAGWSISLAPFGAFPRKTVDALAKFYLTNYGITVKILPTAAVSDLARDPQRKQLIAEELIASLKAQYPKLVADPRAAIIGLVTDDLYIRSRVDWRWAFGLRQEDRYGVVSTARMAYPGNASAALRMTRLRKMVTRYVGFLYFGLAPSLDPKSVLFADIGGVDDLDRVGEKF